VSLRRRILSVCTACIAVFMAVSPVLAQTDVAQKKSTAPAEKELAAGPSKADVAQSQKLYQRAMRLTSAPSTLPDAFNLLEESSSLNPTDVASVTAREFVREELVSEHMTKGDSLMELSNPTGALDEFRKALALDPANAYATQRVHDAVSQTAKPRAKPVYEYGSEPELNPKPGVHTFNLKGDSRQLLTTIGRAFGITTEFDSSFTPRQVKVNLDNVDFATAMHIACMMAHCFHIAVSDHEMIVANDSQDTRRNVERTSVRTFYVPTEAGAQALPEIVNILRSVLEIRFLAPDIATNAITIRAPKQTLDAAAMLISQMTAPRPQVLLEIRVLRLDESASKQIGIAYPLQFTLFNLNTAASSLGPDAVGIINRLRAGTATAQDLAAAAALLASGGLANSVFSQGFAVFGGGLTTSGLVVPPASLNFNVTRSLFTNIEHVTLRASQGQAATFRVGDRFPVITATFSPAITIPGVTSAIKGGQPIIPSYSYEDLGVTLKATPQIGADSTVRLNMDLAIKALGTTSLNNIPTITNRQYVGTISLRDGETSVIAGSMDKSDTKTVSGMPWLSSLPGFGRAFSNNGRTTTADQLLILVTPHIITQRPDAEHTEMSLDND
jgi:general secretion pathway protein D